MPQGRGYPGRSATMVAMRMHPAQRRRMNGDDKRSGKDKKDEKPKPRRIIRR